MNIIFDSRALWAANGRANKQKEHKQRANKRESRTVSELALTMAELSKTNEGSSKTASIRSSL